MAGSKVSEIPTAPVTDLDLSVASDREEWERRVLGLAARRLEQARERLTAMGVVDENGDLRSDELPSDMLPDSKTTLETG